MFVSLVDDTVEGVERITDNIEPAECHTCCSMYLLLLFVYFYFLHFRETKCEESKKFYINL